MDGRLPLVKGASLHTSGCEQACLDAFGDYQTDNRGDVGSWVREAAMHAALPLIRLATPPEHGAPGSSGEDSAGGGAPAPATRPPPSSRSPRASSAAASAGSLAAAAAALAEGGVGGALLHVLGYGSSKRLATSSSPTPAVSGR